MLVVAPNMHDFQGLFLLPAMLRIRREFALLAALLTATATGRGLVARHRDRRRDRCSPGVRWPVAYEPDEPPVT